MSDEVSLLEMFCAKFRIKAQSQKIVATRLLYNLQ